MALSTTGRFQLRLIACHVAGVVAESAAMPYLIAWGLELQNLVLAWIVGAVLFLVLALAGGFIWRRSIMAHPIRWATAAPPVLALAIFALISAPGGFEPGEAGVAIEVGLVGGICALFSSAFLVLSTMLGDRSSRRPG